MVLVLQKKSVKIFLIVVVDVITTGNHVWDQKETIKHIEKENRLLRPENLIKAHLEKDLNIFTAKNN